MSVRKKLMETALYYESQGFSVIPIRDDKKPFVKWEEFQKRRATPEEIKKWWRQNPTAMIGLVTGAISNIVVVDIDDPASKESVKDAIPDELMKPLALPICQTPRGGWHLYFKHPGVTIGNAVGFLPGVDFRGDGGYVVAPPSTTAGGKGYSWLPKLSVWQVAPPGLPEKISYYIQKNPKGGVWGGKHTHSIEVNGEVMTSEGLQMTSNDFKIFQEGARNDQMFSVANRLVKGGMNAENIFQVMEKLNESCSPPLPEKEVRSIFLSAIKRGEARSEPEILSLADGVRDFTMTSNGSFGLQDVCKALGVTSRQGQKNVAVEMLRAKAKGTVIKVGDRNGYYRRLDNDIETIDIFAENVRYHRVLLPMGLNNKVRIMEKNIIIIAGGSDAGKTAFLLNVAMLNLGEGKISYFSSEMGPLELRGRLEYFAEEGIPLDHWKKVNFLSRSQNFADVIDPEGINIIDYLEIHNDFYLVGQLIKDIFDRLTSGIAFIAIQKPEGRETALGGGRSLDKARLYIALDRPDQKSDDKWERENNKARIVKAKNWFDPLANPNGLEMFYKLVKGHKFVPTWDWHPLEERSPRRRN